MGLFQQSPFHAASAALPTKNSPGIKRPPAGTYFRGHGQLRQVSMRVLRAAAQFAALQQPALRAGKFCSETVLGYGQKMKSCQKLYHALQEANLKKAKTPKPSVQNASKSILNMSNIPNLGSFSMENLQAICPILVNSY